MATTWGGGGSLITWPASYGCTPARLELGKQPLQAASTNPFTGAQQIQDWQNGYIVGSCQMPVMDAADGAAMQFFLDELDGIVNVFQFPGALASNALYYYWLTTNNALGGPMQVFRMTQPDHKVSISPGGIYRLTFEFRSAT